MNIIEKYYIRKAHLNQKDEFYGEIEKGDIELMKRAKLYLFIVPIVTFSACYIGKELRTQMFMSQHFYYVIKRAQERY